MSATDDIPKNVKQALIDCNILDNYEVISQMMMEEATILYGEPFVDLYILYTIYPSSCAPYFYSQDINSQIYKIVLTFMHNNNLEAENGFYYIMCNLIDYYVGVRDVDKKKIYIDFMEHFTKNTHPPYTVEDVINYNNYYYEKKG